MYPTTLDDFTPHVDGVDDVMAIDVNELQTALEAIEAKLGINSSAVSSSHDYKINALELGRWSLNGNTLGAKKTIGSIDNQDFGIITNGLERGTVLKNGDVGIGTSNPSSLLNVNGQVTLNGASTDGSGALMYIKATSGYGGLTVDMPSGAYTTFSASGVPKWYFGNNANYDFVLATTAFNRAQFIVKRDGNVGIGTTNPTAKLDIDSDILRLRTAKTPATSGASGNQGDIAWDSGYVYVCTATNTWKRSALTTW